MIVVKLLLIADRTPRFSFHQDIIYLIYLRNRTNNDYKLFTYSELDVSIILWIHPNGHFRFACSLRAVVQFLHSVNSASQTVRSEKNGWKRGNNFSSAKLPEVKNTSTCRFSPSPDFVQCIQHIDASENIPESGRRIRTCRLSLQLQCVQIKQQTKICD